MTSTWPWLRYMLGGGPLLLAALGALRLPRSVWCWKWTDERGVEHVNDHCFDRIELPLLRFVGAHHEEP